LDGHHDSAGLEPGWQARALQLVCGRLIWKSPGKTRQRQESTICLVFNNLTKRKSRQKRSHLAFAVVYNTRTVITGTDSIPGNIDAAQRL
jgi:hypothetical protein